ncbi:hypothetical protein IQ241_06575 [Romeria aff. gracilis LEGE 07310]|uniref:Outer membrane protein beta-barrel domain-containing protein n=1 Tax=Vasconcelosia minhoensis LEGE 07310 TaxID=915328 RepID=A0A8J7AG88_9CYAN|nr:hypothetical protein [Romeria gracilis]MBE9076963.1 hypothetical protein [Romeria aff. gracilis LEGE 07310]
MKFNARILAPFGLAAAALVALPLGASAQTAQTGYNYVGIGGGDEGFTVNGKIAVANNISVRPAVSTDFDFDDSEDVSYLLPITYDFNSPEPSGRLLPFAGAGIRGDIGDDSTVDFAVTAGTDYRINNRLIANGSLNWAPFAENSRDDVNFTVGLGYAF